jgi:L-lactate dehydrogenase complex protein LldE
MLAKRTFEFTEYLVDVLGITDVGAHWDGTLTYHPSCHLSRGLGIDRQPRALLANVKGAQIVELPEAEDCCGFGGIFSVAHPELSAEFLKRKISNLEKTESPTLVVADTGCIMHIAGRPAQAEEAAKGGAHCRSAQPSLWERRCSANRRNSTTRFMRR